MDPPRGLIGGRRRTAASASDGRPVHEGVRVVLPGKGPSADGGEEDEDGFQEYRRVRVGTQRRCRRGGVRHRRVGRSDLGLVHGSAYVRKRGVRVDRVHGVGCAGRHGVSNYRGVGHGENS